MIIMESHISITQVARKLSDIINRVRYCGEVFIVERGKEPVCKISAVSQRSFKGSDLKALFKTLPKPDPAFWDDVEQAIKNQSPALPPAWPS